MGMNSRAMPLLLAAAVLAAPAAAFASGALGEAGRTAANPAAFDGSSARPAGDAVPAGATGERRTAEQIAAAEQAAADARAKQAPAIGSGKENEPPKPNEWLKGDHIRSGVKGAIIGALIGSLWGLTGLGVGVLVGGLIGYGLSKFTAS